jgi:ATP-dependent DNA ligase
MGLEGIVSKRRDFYYRSGPSKSWIKVKNPKSPAMLGFRRGRGESGDFLDVREGAARRLHPRRAALLSPVDLVDIEMMAHGGSVLKVRKVGGSWSVVSESNYARRIPTSRSAARQQARGVRRA